MLAIPPLASGWRQKNQSERDRLLAEAMRVMGSLSAQGEWELHWLKTAAQMAGDAELGKAADRELQQRKSGRGSASTETGDLPEVQK